MDVRGERRAGLLVERYSMRPTCRCNRDITSKPIRAPLEFCESNRNEGSTFGNLIEIRHALGLGEIMLQQPFFADKFRSCIVRVQWLVSMHQNMPVEVHIFERRQ